MSDILHDVPVAAPPGRVWEACATPQGLDAWWTLRAKGDARVGAIWELYFGDAYDWRAIVTRAEYGRLIEWTMARSDADWEKTVVSVELEPSGDGSLVRFRHRGWIASNAHYRTSSFCWAMYLRLMKRWCETGEVVPYERRLEA